MLKYDEYKFADDKIGVYYIFDYVPENNPGLIIDEYDLKIQRWILDYKDAGDSMDAVVRRMTDSLSLGLAELSSIANKRFYGRITEYEKYLMAVPRSDFGSKSTVAKSIEIICNQDKSYMDKSYLLLRTEEHESQHKRGKRYSIEEHEKTLDCLYPNMDKVKKSVFFLIDDIVTSGATLVSCVRTLEKHGVNRNKVFCLALARTRS